MSTGPRGGAHWCGKGDPSGIRTRVTAVRGRRTRPLYDGALQPTHEIMALNPSGRQCGGENPQGPACDAHFEG